ncbi:MAG TPA: AAA family ATPase [Candidatus Blautia gallistercoris]|uniref:AAA family ATPase n=1 Tax=Candidatus Blautia gallistercoris TaxID=2838490 RepID=A0A9D2B311_9FIRM|nr:AAA family ATPase [Candidatus Blautia gallistercoris]
MNIAQAKKELIHTVWAYTAKNEQGQYRIPRVRQRPVLLMGPPGIGKTAIMEQVAGECGIGLVAYTMTHHTRQSAIGLPMVQTRCFDGQEYTVTEYTMSEIIASIYQTMERTGCREGILFLDEINCVSETLAPVMLQFLQNKAFGGHKLPEGWIIAAAGNPREYNKSAREFDIATLDRVRQMDIRPDLDAWKQYARKAGIHGSILSYLTCRPESFYHIQQTAEGKEFVTARGWEDLSVMLKEHERMGLPVETDFIREYLACETIAEDFSSFYKMSQEYRKQCPVDEILNGTLAECEKRQMQERLRSAGKDETFSVSGWLLSGVLYLLDEADRSRRSLKKLREMAENFWNYEKSAACENAVSALEEYVERNAHALAVKEQAEFMPESQIREEKEGLRSFREYLAVCRGNHRETREEICALLSEDFEKKEGEWKDRQDLAAAGIRQSVLFLEETFGFREELLSFLTGICTHPEMEAMEKREDMEEYGRALSCLQIAQREAQLEKMFGEERQ